eukprot:jgi/Orpsp1_1/1187877/evm.model.d7180000060856.1
MDQFYFCIIFYILINICTAKYINVCKVIGDKNLFSIYSDGKNPKFFNFYDQVYFGDKIYNIGYCECYTETRNCRVEFFNNKNYEKRYKAILEFEYQEDINMLKLEIPNYPENIQTNIANPDFDSIFKDYNQYLQNMKNTSIEYYYSNALEYKLVSLYKPNPDVDSIFFTFSALDNQYDVLESYIELSPLKTLMDENKLFSLYYSPRLSIYKRDMFKYYYPFGGFKIRNILECYYNGNDIQHYQYSYQDTPPFNIDCTWGNTSYVSEKINEGEREKWIYEVNHSNGFIFYKIILNSFISFILLNIILYNI